MFTRKNVELQPGKSAQLRGDDRVIRLGKNREISAGRSDGLHQLSKKAGLTAVTALLFPNPAGNHQQLHRKTLPENRLKKRLHIGSLPFPDKLGSPGLRGLPVDSPGTAGTDCSGQPLRRATLEKLNPRSDLQVVENRDFTGNDSLPRRRVLEKFQRECVESASRLEKIWPQNRSEKRS